MDRKPFAPNLHTPQDKYSKEELNKLASKGFLGNLKTDFRDNSRPDLVWEAEAIAKSHGIYLEFNRAKTGNEKEWVYMVRISIPGGGPLNRGQWNVIDDLTEKYTRDSEGRPSIRLTTRQNIQFHWIKKEHVVEVIKTLAESGLNTLNGCGDNTRNVMGCPLSRFSDVYDANAMAQKAGLYFQLPLEPFIEVWAIDPKYLRKPEESFQYGPNLLNRKFKIAFSGVVKDEATGHLVADNCVEALTHDLAVVPVIESNASAKGGSAFGGKFQIYVGGGQGERNGKPSMACLGKPLGIVDKNRLFKTLDAVVQVHQEWGDRENRVWARLKYVIKKMGAAWYREQVEKKLGFKLEPPNPSLDPGARHMHHGWFKQATNGLWSYGAFIENGRLIDSGPNGKLKSMCRHLVNRYPVELLITPNQDALFSNIPEASKKEFEADLAKFGFGKRNGKAYSTLRLLSGACVGRDTCRLTYTDSEKFEPFLIDELETLGWGELAESIGITGCERQCFRPATKTVGLVGSGLNRYQLKLMGTEDARHQGLSLVSPDGNDIYLRSIPRERVAAVLDALFKFWKAKAKPGEDLGYFNRRIGMEGLISHFKENPITADLMAKPFPADCIIE
ncbi:MAG: nitrite/sulfite reductase [Candidatus Omnitrophota bacterium]|nr:nitrite/sulfite reductase [Candidatus Omnitrophota bacterium]